MFADCTSGYNFQIYFSVKWWIVCLFFLTFATPIGYRRVLIFYIKKNGNKNQISETRT